MAWIHLRLRPASLGKKKKEITGLSSIAGFSFGREPPEHSVVTSEVVGLVLVAVDAQAAELMAVEAPLLGDIEAALGAVRAVLALAAVESAPALAKAV